MRIITGGIARIVDIIARWSLPTDAKKRTPKRISPIPKFRMRNTLEKRLTWAMAVCGSVSCIAVTYLCLKK